MKEVVFLPRFKKGLGRTLKKNPAAAASLEEAIGHLARGDALPAHFSDHALAREFSGMREFHLDDDLLVIYRDLTDAVKLHRIGSHADLFDAK